MVAQPWDFDIRHCQYLPQHLTKCRGQKSFPFQQMRFVLGWEPKPKLDDGLEAWLKGYR